jgi:hypothetical protein
MASYRQRFSMKTSRPPQSSGGAEHFPGYGYANFHVTRYPACEAGVVDAAVNARSVGGGTVPTRASAFVHIGVIQ